MKYQTSIFANPSVVYFIVWIPLMLVSRMDLFFFSTRGSFAIEAFILFLVFNFIIVYGFCSIIFSTRKQISSKIDIVEVYALRKFTVNIFKIWIVGFLINIIASGGLPIYWVLNGEIRTYSSFGIPTFSGFINMIRMFIVIAFVICTTFKVPVPKYIILIILFSFCAELNRASILFGILGGAGAFLLFNKLRFLNMLKMLGVVALFLISFSFIAEFRELGRGGYISPSEYFNADVAAYGAALYVVLYYATPLNNLYYQFSLGLEPTYTPFFTFQSLLPTVIRDQIFTGETIYSVEFASSAFNTSPYIANIISDFGLMGAAVIVTILQFLCCYVFIRAARLSLEHCLMASLLWGATALSVFTNLYFTLIVVAFPILIIIFNNYKRRYIKLQ